LHSFTAYAAKESAKIMLHPEIQRHLDKGEHLSLLINARGNMLQSVDFVAKFVPRTINLGYYQILLSDRIGPQQVVCIFPNHRNDRQQVLAVQDYKSLASFNKAFNRALQESLERTETAGTLKLAVCFGSHVIKCVGISGTVYLVWAQYVNMTTSGNMTALVNKDVPLLFNMDGEGRVKGLYMLKEKIKDPCDLERIPITEKNPQLMWEQQMEIFVCETKFTPVQEKTIVTTTRRSALARITSSAKIPVESIYNAFEGSVDLEHMELQFEVDSGTPRRDLFELVPSGESVKTTTDEE
jgi:hypothetical protein